MSDPDFDELRRKRDEVAEQAMRDACAEMGWNTEGMTFHSGASGCYCDCANGGPCEHEFEGWREFDDGRGGERVCKKCGCGAMSHTLHIGL